MHTGTGDALDGYWYNNAMASGSQMYPSGLSKYFDMYSTSGVIDYWWSMVWYEICNVTGLLFLLGVPLDLVLDWINGLSFKGIINIMWYFIPFGNLVVWLLQIKVQDGWTMM